VLGRACCITPPPNSRNEIQRQQKATMKIYNLLKKARRKEAKLLPGQRYLLRGLPGKYQSLGIFICVALLIYELGA
jgi:hypothetical protein